MARKGVKREPERIPITEEMQSMLLAWGGGDSWAQIGAAVWQWHEDAKAANPRAKFDTRKFYEDCGVFVGKAANTVRQYRALAEDTDGVRDEFPQFGMAHWMLFRAQAKREGRHIWEVAGDWATTEADYAGRPVPVDVVRAALKAKGAEKPKSIGEFLERAYKALQEACKLAEGDEYAELGDALNIVVAAQQRHEHDGDGGGDGDE